MPQIVAVRTKDDSSRDSIAVVLSQDAVCLGPDGQPWSGVSLSAPLARSLAERLLGLAKEIENQENRPSSNAFRSLVHVRSILALHDGSEQGHRAFALAADLASRSLASIQLVGIYGVDPDASSIAEYHHWQKAWLERLAQMYSREAEQSGLKLETLLVAANDGQGLTEVFESREFDLVVLPRKFADGGEVAEAVRAFRQSLAGASESTILFCA